MGPVHLPGDRAAKASRLRGQLLRRGRRRTRHPLHEKWPLTILSTVTFAEANGKTTITVKWIPVDATETEQRTFEEGRDSMKAGWTGTFDRLDDCLIKT